MNELSPLRQEDYQAAMEQVRTLIKERDELRCVLAAPEKEAQQSISFWSAHGPPIIIAGSFLFCLLFWLAEALM